MYFASLEVFEEGGKYSKAELYRKKDCSSVIVLHLDGEFEGLDGKYSMTEDNKILDPDGDEIVYRNMSKLSPIDSSAMISTGEVIAANAKFGKKRLTSAFCRRHRIVRGYFFVFVAAPGCLSVHYFAACLHSDPIT